MLLSGRSAVTVTHQPNFALDSPMTLRPCAVQQQQDSQLRSASDHTAQRAIDPSLSPTDKDQLTLGVFDCPPRVPEVHSNQPWSVRFPVPWGHDAPLHLETWVHRARLWKRPSVHSSRGNRRTRPMKTPHKASLNKARQAESQWSPRYDPK